MKLSKETPNVIILEPEIPTAQEAKKQTNLCAFMCLARSINESIQNGEYGISYCGKISKETMSILKSKGYKIEVIGNENVANAFFGPTYLISWE